jgi:hypothetical protein
VTAGGRIYLEKGEKMKRLKNVTKGRRSKDGLGVPRNFSLVATT